MLAANCGLVFSRSYASRVASGRVNGAIASLIVDGSLGFELSWRVDLRA
jgi:hypothetical protein